MKKFCLTLIFAWIAMTCAQAAVNYDDWFDDATLRLDLIMTGSPQGSDVSLSNLKKSPNWYGRRVNLDKLHLLGNGQIYVRDAETGETIYANSFSTLFQEWLGTAEAQNGEVRAFQNTLTIPMPKRKALVEINLNDASQKSIANRVFTVNPEDILIVNTANMMPNPYRYIHQGADPKEAVNVVIMGEGYTATEQAKFQRDAEEAVDAILSHEPFKSRKDDLNFIAVSLVSENTGVSVPKNDDWRDTAFSSHFSTFYSNRYLTTDQLFAVHDALINVPYEHIIILANVEEYGGGGILNSYTLTAAGHPKFRPVVVHEFGHSFGGLADEYFYENDAMTDTYDNKIEPWEPNVTSLVDFGSKWQDMIADGEPVPTPVKDADKYKVGAYEGAAYSTYGMYRPVDWCRMRTNDCDGFCPVCVRAIDRMIDYYTKESK